MPQTSLVNASSLWKNFLSFRKNGRTHITPGSLHFLNWNTYILSSSLIVFVFIYFFNKLSLNSRVHNEINAGCNFCLISTRRCLQQQKKCHSSFFWMTNHSKNVMDFSKKYLKILIFTSTHFFLSQHLQILKNRIGLLKGLSSEI